MILLLSLSALVSLIAAIYTQYKGPKSWFYIFKPLTTTIIISIAGYGIFHSTPSVPAAYPYLMIISLVICLIGDICIMMGDKTFLPGLVSFAIAHILFGIAFFTVTGWVFTWWLFLIMVAFTVIMIAYLLPFIKKQMGEPIDLTLPVIVYSTLIGLMIWLSLERFYMFRDTPALLTMIGAILFGISDTTLALNKFKHPFHSAELIILGTYFPAIWLFALSV
jgi:uncharacterized membrane protein YhhN